MGELRRIKDAIQPSDTLLLPTPLPATACRLTSL